MITSHGKIFSGIRKTCAVGLFRYIMNETLPETNITRQASTHCGTTFATHLCREMPVCRDNLYNLL